MLGGWSTGVAKCCGGEMVGERDEQRASSATDGFPEIADSRRPGCSGAVQSTERSLKQSLKRPPAGQVDEDAARRTRDQGSELEQLAAQRFDLRALQTLGQTMAEQHDQIVSRRMQQQTKGIGQKAVTTQAVGGEAVLEFLDAVLAFAASMVESEDLLGRSAAVGNHVA